MSQTYDGQHFRRGERGYEQARSAADENLGQRPARFLSDEHMRRLEELRARHDPRERFHSWMS
jgi:hypothetical protein